MLSLLCVFVKYFLCSVQISSKGFLFETEFLNLLSCLLTVDCLMLEDKGQNVKSGFTALKMSQL